MRDGVMVGMERSKVNIPPIRGCASLHIEGGAHPLPFILPVSGCNRWLAAHNKETVMSKKQYVIRREIVQLIVNRGWLVACGRVVDLTPAQSDAMQHVLSGDATKDEKKLVLDLLMSCDYDDDITIQGN